MAAAGEVLESGLSLISPAIRRRFAALSSEQAARRLTEPLTMAELRRVLESSTMRQLVKSGRFDESALPIVSSRRMSPEAEAAVARIIRGGESITTPDSMKDIINLSSISPTQRAKLLRADPEFSQQFEEQAKGMQNIVPTESGFTLRGETDLIPFLPEDVDVIQQALQEISLRRALGEGADLTDITTAYRSPTFVTQDPDYIRTTGPLSYSRSTAMYPEVEDIYEADVPTYAILGDARIGQNFNPVEDEIIVASNRVRDVRGPYGPERYGIPPSNFKELIKKLGLGG